MHLKWTFEFTSGKHHHKVDPKSKLEKVEEFIEKESKWLWVFKKSLWPLIAAAMGFFIRHFGDGFIHNLGH